MRKGKRPVYYTYLLRCWQEGKTWRFSLEEVTGGRRQYGFPDLEALAAFLRTKTMAEGTTKTPEESCEG